MERRSPTRVDLGVIWSVVIGDHTDRLQSILPLVSEAAFLDAGRTGGVRSSLLAQGHVCGVYLDLLCTVWGQPRKEVPS